MLCDRRYIYYHCSQYVVRGLTATVVWDIRFLLCQRQENKIKKKTPKPTTPPPMLLLSLPLELLHHGHVLDHTLHRDTVAIRATCNRLHRSLSPRDACLRGRPRAVAQICKSLRCPGRLLVREVADPFLHALPCDSHPLLTAMVMPLYVLPVVLTIVDGIQNNAPSFKKFIEFDQAVCSRLGIWTNMSCVCEQPLRFARCTYGDLHAPFRPGPGKQCLACLVDRPGVDKPCVEPGVEPGVEALAARIPDSFTFHLAYVVVLSLPGLVFLSIILFCLTCQTHFLLVLVSAFLPLIDRRGTYGLT